jgi:uncharacterized protein YndB with AHSA1/START domain
MANLHPWPRRGLTIDFTQHVRVGPERVWSALTREAELQAWLGVSRVDMPLTKGAPFTFEWHTQGRASGDAPFTYEGRVHDVVPERLLALEWGLHFADGETQFSVQIQPSFAEYGFERDAECDIWIIHAGFPTEGVGLFEYDGMSRHWRQSLANLVSRLEGRPAARRLYAITGLQFVGGAPDQGVMIADVIMGSPAHVAGIRAGDVIASVDGTALHSVDDFHDWVAARVPGEQGTFDIAGRAVTVTLESSEEALARFQVRHGDRWDRADATLVHAGATGSDDEAPPPEDELG